MRVLDTERLSLSRFSNEDAEFVLALLNDPSFHQFIGDRGVRVLEDARNYIAVGPQASYARHGFGLYLVTRISDGMPIGMCGLLKRDTLEDVDIGFAFLPEYWGAGYATEAALAVVEHARSDIGLRRLVAIVSPENAASKAVLQRLGLAYERTTRLTPDAHEVDLFARDLAAGSAPY